MLLGGLLCCCEFGFAQQQNIDPVALVRHATQNEIAATGPTKPPFFIYKDHTQYKDHSITTDSIETPDGGLNRTIAKNGKPLTAQEQADADQKLKSFAYDSEARRKKRQANHEDDQQLHHTDEEVCLMRLITPLPASPRPQTVMTWCIWRSKPKPGFPGRHLRVKTRVLEGMEGDMIVDQTAGRIAEINGQLFKDVDFGWGILGRLFKGGKFVIHQADVGGKWEETQERLQFNGKVLMVKNLTIDSNETMTDFRPVPSNITTALRHCSCCRILTKVVAQNGEGAASKQ